MGDALRTIRIATQDQTVLSTARAALRRTGEEPQGFAVQQVGAWRASSGPPAPGDVLILDSWLKDGNVYEMLRHLAGRTKCRPTCSSRVRTASPSPSRATAARPACSIVRSPAPSSRRPSANRRPRPALASRPAAPGPPTWLHFPETLLAELTGNGAGGEDSAPVREESDAIMGALIDPVTGLFNYSFLSYKITRVQARASLPRAARLRDARLREPASDDTCAS